jgi:hypothetical protein
MPLFEVIRPLKMDQVYYGPGHAKSVGNEIELDDEEQIAELIEAGAIQEQTFGQEEVAALQQQIADLKEQLQEKQQESRTKLLARKVKLGPSRGKIVTLQQLRQRRRAG